MLVAVLVLYVAMHGLLYCTMLWGLSEPTQLAAR